MGIEITVVDAFTDQPFAGNPAAVCILDKPADEKWMRLVAREMNLAETAFLHPIGHGYSLRWFTPSVEVDLCGHATLAAAHVLWESNRLHPEEFVTFETRSGKLSARRHEGWIELDFPATPPTPAPVPDGLQAALGAKPVSVWLTPFDLLVELESEAVVRSLDPDLNALKRFGSRGTIVTARSNAQPYDFISRFFAPQSGVPEDPVTGSAHCALAPFWATRLNKTELCAYQASQRGGVIRVIVQPTRVLLLGHAVTIHRSELLIAP